MEDGRWNVNGSPNNVVIIVVNRIYLLGVDD